MKGIILAGGGGTRLLPCTKVTNKHLLPVYNQPMIYYPIQFLIKAGIDQILIVTGGNYAGDFLKLLGNGKNLGIKELNYTYQEGFGGIADALRLSEDFADEDKVAVILGDNIFEDDFSQAVKDFENQEQGAKFFLKEVNDPKRFGVAEVQKDKIVQIKEKPKHPKSNYAVTGFYMYDSNVFKVIKTLKPSARGELEITDVNNFYVKQRTASFEMVKGFWSDAGTWPSLWRSSKFMSEHSKIN